MSMDKSLRRRGRLLRSRNVLTRAERITALEREERWTDESSPFGLPKVRVQRRVKRAKGAAPAAEVAAAPAAETEKPAAEKGTAEKPAGKGAPAKGGGKGGKA